MERTYIINNKGRVATVPEKNARKIVGTANFNEQTRKSGDGSTPKHRFSLDGWRYATKAETEWLIKQHEKTGKHPVKIDLVSAHTADVSQKLDATKSQLEESERKRQLLEKQLEELKAAQTAEQPAKPRTRGRKPKTEGGDQ